MFFFTALAFAQPDTRPLAVPSGAGIKIPAATAPPAAAPAIPEKPPVFSNKPKSSGFEAPPLNSNFGKAREKFANPNASVEEKLNDGNYKLYDRTEMKDTHLGDIRTKSGVLRVSYRDYSALDGDIVRIYVDGVVIIRAVVLDGVSKGFDIPIEKGLHAIYIEALSEGDSPPNTAEFTIFDNEGNALMSNQWSLSVGYRASIGVFRE